MFSICGDGNYSLHVCSISMCDTVTSDLTLPFHGTNLFMKSWFCSGNSSQLVDTMNAKPCSCLNIEFGYYSSAYLCTVGIVCSHVSCMISVFSQGVHMCFKASCVPAWSPCQGCNAVKRPVDWYIVLNTYSGYCTDVVISGFISNIKMKMSTFSTLWMDTMLSLSCNLNKAAKKYIQTLFSWRAPKL